MTRTVKGKEKINKEEIFDKFRIPLDSCSRLKLSDLEQQLKKALC